MTAPDDRRYSAEHEWAMAVGDDVVRLGITDYAQDALGDIVYVDLPAVGATFTSGETMAEVESTKSVADIFAPMDGEIVTVNDRLEDEPELVNSDPYGDGWFVELKMTNPAVLDGMLDAAAYGELATD